MSKIQPNSAEHVEVLRKELRFERAYGNEQAHRYMEDLAGLTKEVMRVAAERDAALAEVQRLREAVRNLLIKLDAALPKLDGLCALASVHGAPYTGPTLHEEIAAARSLVEPAP